MATVQRKRWDAEPGRGLSRRDRLGCEYETYIPDALMGRPFQFSGETAADIADAEAAIMNFNQESQVLLDSEALARLLLRTEAVASSRIEGIRLGSRRLLRAEAAIEAGSGAADVTAEEILGNIQAMVWAVDTAAGAAAFSVELLREIHARLLEGTQLASTGGEVRRTQNWIGGSSYNPCSAVFVPPPPELVHRLLEDLCTFCNQDSLSPLAQAAVAHAQFETIHPFADGNGRTGRALVHAILRRRGLAPRFVPPISLVLARRSADYVNGLMGTRYAGDAESAPARAGIEHWLSVFASASMEAVAKAHAFESEVAGITAKWRGKLGRVRAGSAVELIVAALPAAPILTVSSAARMIGRTYQATNLAMDRLVAAEVLRPVRVGRRNRAFEASDLVTAFTEFEGDLGFPS